MESLADLILSYLEDREVALWSDDPSKEARLNTWAYSVQDVQIDDRLKEMIISTCMEFDIKTHRAEITSLRASKAIAALAGRDAVHFEDVREAMQLALPHRMRRKPFEPPVLNGEKLDKTLEDWKKKSQDQSGK